MTMLKRDGAVRGFETGPLRQRRPGDLVELEIDVSALSANAFVRCGRTQ